MCQNSQKDEHGYKKQLHQQVYHIKQLVRASAACPFVKVGSAVPSLVRCGSGGTSTGATGTASGLAGSGVGGYGPVPVGIRLSHLSPWNDRGSGVDPPVAVSEPRESGRARFLRNGAHCAVSRCRLAPRPPVRRPRATRILAISSSYGTCNEGSILAIFGCFWLILAGVTAKSQ